MLSHEEYKDVRSPYVDEFLSYLVDTLRSFLHLSVPDFSFDHVFCAGGLFESRDIVDRLASLMSEDHHKKLRILTFSDILKTDYDEVVPS